MDKQRNPNTNLTNSPRAEDAALSHSAAPTLPECSATVARSGGDGTIRISVHPNMNRLPRGRNKAELRADKARICSASTNGMRAVEKTLPQLAALLDAGYGFSAEMTDGHRCNDSANAQHIQIDDDLGDPQFEEKIRSLECAAIIGATATEGHHCAIVFIDEATSDPELYRKVFIRVNYRLGAVVDPAGNVISQPRLGFRKGTTRLIEGAFLTIAEIMSWDAPPEATIDYDARRAERNYQPIEKNSDAAARKVAAWRDHAYQKVATTPENQNRTGAAYGQARPLARLIAHYPISETDIERDLLDACRANGAVELYGERKCLAAIRRGITKGLKDIPEPLEVPTLKATTPAPLEVPTLEAGERQNQPYINIPTSAPVIAVQSGVGTGKTTAAIRVIGDARSALSIVHRERLAENKSNDALKQNVIIEHYKGLSKADRRRPSRLAICINSYSALADDEQGLPVHDVLELDEIEQTLEHIYGEAGTLKGRKAIEAADALKYAIRQSPRILAMDAHLSALAIDFLKAQGRDPLVVVNEYITPRGALTIHAKSTGALTTLRALVSANQGVVALAMASRERARVVADDLIDQLGNSDDVLLITADNAGGERQAAFLANPNAQIVKYRAVVYSPVIGTGFDITAPVRAVVGIMAAHLTAEDARQMIGRCRNTQETHVYLPQTSGTLEESAAEIEAIELQKAERTLRRLNEKGVRKTFIFDDAQRDYLHWHARVMARRNWSINHLRAHFVSLCAGYSISYSEHADPELSAQQEAIRQALTEQRKALVLTVTPLDDDAYHKLRDAGKADEAAIAGNQRWRIESVVGVTISPAVRDQLWTHQQRRSLRNFTDLIDDLNAVKLFDAHEDKEGVPLPRRKHRSIRRIVVNSVLRALMDSDGELLNLDKSDLESAVAPVITKWGQDLKLYFGWRPDQCKSAAATVRRVLDTVGLKLNSEQRTVGGKHVRMYQVDAAICEQVRALARQRLVMLQRQRLEAIENRYGANAADPLNLKTHNTTVYTGDVGFEIAPNPVIEPPGFTSPEAAAHLERMLDALGVKSKAKREVIF